MADSEWQEVPDEWQEVKPTEAQLFNNPINNTLRGISQFGNNFTNAMTTSIPEFLTGTSLQQGGINAMTPNTPPNTRAPYDANVQTASQPFNRAVQIGGATTAGMLGQIGDNVLSPVGLMGAGELGVASRIRALNQGAQFDTLTKGEIAVDGIHTRANTLGQQVGQFYKNPDGTVTSMGSTPIPLNSFQSAIDKLPKPMQKVMQDAAQDGTLDMNSDGSVAAHVSNAHEIRMLVNSNIKSSYWNSLKNAPQKTVVAKGVSDTLGSLIDTASPTVKLVNAPYSNFMKVSQPILDKVENPKTGDINMNPFRNMVAGKEEDSVLRNYFETKQQVPELDDLHNTLTNQARMQAVGNSVKKLLHVGETGGIMGATFKAMTGNSTSNDSH